MTTHNPAAAPSLIPIGYWPNEDDEGTDVFVMPQALVDPAWASEDRSRLVDYLNSGTLVREWLGHEPCLMDASVPDHEMGCGEYSDGVWIWPEGLSVYVGRFQVRLPDEFLKHVRANAFVNPRPHPDEVRGRGIDYEFWIEWCQDQRSLHG